MSRRFFVDSPIKDAAAVLIGQEAQHLSKVMRAKIGDELILFDGSGAEFSARIEKIGRSEVELEVLTKYEVSRELPFRFVLGAALPKGDRQRWLVEKLVELGVAELIPLVTTRSVAQPSGNALERLRRAVIEASKQCGRNRLMTIGEARSLEAFLADDQGSDTKWIAHPPSGNNAAPDPIAETGTVLVAIGPEGGFTDGELDLSAEHGWHRISFGARVLRTETAAVAITAAIAWQRELVS